LSASGIASSSSMRASPLRPNARLPVWQAQRRPLLVDMIERAPDHFVNVGDELSLPP
jgi:hypothetical protein